MEGERELQQVVTVELIDGARRDGGHTRRRLLLRASVSQGKPGLWVRQGYGYARVMGEPG